MKENYTFAKCIENLKFSNFPLYPEAEPSGNSLNNRWDQLSGYLHDWVLEIDNNLVENAIRPVALGRKNYLFADSHEAVQRAAMIYSFFSICKSHQINPYQWLRYVLENIMSTKYNDIRELYLQNFKSNM